VFIEVSSRAVDHELSKEPRRLEVSSLRASRQAAMMVGGVVHVSMIDKSGTAPSTWTQSGGTNEANSQPGDVIEPRGAPTSPVTLPVQMVYGPHFRSGLVLALLRQG